jgi:hypothetical protein
MNNTFTVLQRPGSRRSCICQSVAGFIIALLFQALALPTIAVAQGVDRNNPNYHGYENDKGFRIGALTAINAGEATSAYTGTGTAVVQFEPANLELSAYYSDSEERVFGDCGAPAVRNQLVKNLKQLLEGAEKKIAVKTLLDYDRTGWVPTGSECKVAWVMHAGGCSWGSCGRLKMRRHPTSVARGILAVAPDTKIISIALQSLNGNEYKHAVEWLTTPPAKLDELNAYYSGLNHYYDDATRKEYYESIFGDKSPAEHWNIVAANASLTSGSSGGMRVPVAARNPNAKAFVHAAFSEPCELSNPGTSEAAPQKYLDDWWAAHGVPEKRLASYRHWDTHSALLKASSIIPLFASGNFLTEEKQTDTGKWLEIFVSQTGVEFPACLSETLAVSAVNNEYDKLPVNNRQSYIGTNAHPTLTDFVAPGGATSFSTPLMSGAVAVIKSANLAPHASADEVIGFLQQSNKQPAPAGFSCSGARKPATDIFPPSEHDSLNCQSPSEKYVPPYALKVLDLKAAVDAAQASLHSTMAE